MDKYRRGWIDDCNDDDDDYEGGVDDGGYDDGGGGGCGGGSEHREKNKGSKTENDKHSGANQKKKPLLSRPLTFLYLTQSITRGQGSVSHVFKWL